jgi:AcrR family transcriptional regulator
MARKSASLAAEPRNSEPSDTTETSTKVTPRRSAGVPTHRSANAQLRKRAMQTKQLLINTAKALFLEYGYAATTIDNIADTAGVSRASFYTYFSSKTEIMVVAGADARDTSCAMFEKLGQVDRANLAEGIEAWVDEYFRLLERDGGYLLTWQQAALKDPKLRKLGMEGTQRSSRILSESLRALGAKGDKSDLVIRSLALRSMLDRFWYHWWLTVAPYERDQVLRNLAAIIQATITI